MRKALCILTVLLLLPACAQKQDARSMKADTARKLCGSRLSVKRALAEADVAIHARALETPEGKQEKEGFTHYVGRFEVLSVLKGNYKNSEFKVLYDCPEAESREHRVEQGEEVIVCIKRRPWFEAVKIVFATEEMKEKVKNAISESLHAAPEGLPPWKLKFMLWDIDSEKPGAKAWFYVGGTYDYNVIYWKEECEPARDNWPINVVGRAAGSFKANDSFEVKQFIFRDNRFSAKVNVFRTETNRIQPQKIAYFGFYLYDVKLKAGDYPLTLNFDIYVKPEAAQDKSRFAESFSEQYTFKVLKGKLCGSQMPIANAVKEADLIVHAKAVGLHLFLIEEFGSASGGGKFEVISVLKGKWEKKEMQVSYECTYLRVLERGVKKGEEVILFIKHSKTSSNQEAIKIVFATDEVIDKIKTLLRQHGGKPGKEVKESEGE